MTITLRRLMIVWLLLFFLRTSLSLAGQQTKQTLIRRYSQQAEQALAKKDTEAAATALEALVRLTPNDPAVDANLGTVYYTQGRYEQAAERFQMALKLNPQIPNVRPLLGLCYAELGRAREAIPLLNPAFQRPANKRVGRLIGIELMDAYNSLDDNFDALEVSEELLRRYPDDPEILYRAGHLYGDRSVQIMRRLVKVAPNSPWKRMAFAEALEAERKYALAIIEYRKVIVLDPAMPEVHYRLGRALLLNSPESNQAQEEAVKQFQEELQLEPRDASAAYELGEIYLRRGQTDAAARDFSLAVRINPRDAQAQIALASVLMSIHRPTEALHHLRVAIQLDPENDIAHFLLASLYRSEKDSAGYQREMALYQKYHVQPFPAKDHDIQ